MSSIAVIGTGYVGLITGAGFADLGNDVVCVDILEEKIAKLRSGIIPFEPGLEEVTRRTADAGRLRFTTDYAQAIPTADFVFITVDTPPTGNGKADMSRVESASRSLAPHLRGRTIIINKSTMPIGSGGFVSQVIRENAPLDADFAVVSNPEFLREGSAVRDVREPDRIVLGGDDPVAIEAVAELYETVNAPIVKTDLRTAEMIANYASNAMLATRISFINEIAAICEEFDADVRVVARGMGLDTRIGPNFLDAGIGFGGSCFPKDVKALAYMAAEKQLHPQLLNSVLDINQDQRRRFAQKVIAHLAEPEASTVGIWGLAFKQDTDDMREAPSVDIIRCLLDCGVRVQAYDPVAMTAAQNLLPAIVCCDDPYDAARGADALLLLTPWSEFRQANMERVFETMRRPVMLDGRNIYDRREMEAMGFTYVGVGR